MRQLAEQRVVADLGFVELRAKSERTGIGGAVRLDARRRKAVDSLRGALSSVRRSPGGTSCAVTCSRLAFARLALRACRARRQRRCARAAAASRQRRCSTSRPTPKTGKIIATFPKPDADGVSARYIYLTQLETGLGSAPIGLDRAAPQRLAHPGLPPHRQEGRRRGREPQVRRSSGTADEQQAARDSFADLDHCGWATSSTTKPDGSFTVDLAGFLARDDLGVPQAIKRGGGGEFKFVPELSAADPNFVKVFPKNAEFAARLTFRSDEPTAEINNIIPGDDTLSMIAAPLADRAARARLRARAPTRTAIRSAAAGGFLGAARSADGQRSRAPLPAREGRSVGRALAGQEADHLLHRPRRARADPDRASRRRQLVERRRSTRPASSTRSRSRSCPRAPTRSTSATMSSTGSTARPAAGPTASRSTIRAPARSSRARSLLGSLRARQDMIIFQALVGAGLTGTGDPNDPITATLARIRQLGAHEVGHAIGLAHNFAASTQGRYSVMDYPAPRIDARERRSVAQGCVWRRRRSVGPVGDQVAVRRQDRRRGARRSSPRRGRRACASSPTMMRGRSARASRKGRLWDDGADPIGELRRMMEVRRVALDRFGTGALPPGEPLADLRRAFVPIWLLDRYQIEAAAKSLGGVDFPYARQRRAVTRADRARARAQWAALYALLDTLSPGGADRPGAASAAAVERLRRQRRPADGDRDHSDRRRTGVRSAQGDRGRRRADAQRACSRPSA